MGSGHIYTRMWAATTRGCSEDRMIITGLITCQHSKRLHTRAKKRYGSYCAVIVGCRVHIARLNTNEVWRGRCPRSRSVDRGEAGLSSEWAWALTMASSLLHVSTEAESYWENHSHICWVEWLSPVQLAFDKPLNQQFDNNKHHYYTKYAETI